MKGVCCQLENKGTTVHRDTLLQPPPHLSKGSFTERVRALRNVSAASPAAGSAQSSLPNPAQLLGPPATAPLAPDSLDSHPRIQSERTASPSYQGSLAMLETRGRDLQNAPSFPFMPGNARTGSYTRSEGEWDGDAHGFTVSEALAGTLIGPHLALESLLYMPGSPASPTPSSLPP